MADCMLPGSTRASEISIGRTNGFALLQLCSIALLYAALPHTSLIQWMSASDMHSGESFAGSPNWRGPQRGP